MWQSVQKICGAIQRVDDPAAGRVTALFRTAFFCQPAIGWARLHQIFFDDLFGCQISFADEIARAFTRHLQIFHLTEVFCQATTRATSGFDHHI